MRLDGKNVIVTGAASGISRAVALMAASYGANIGAADLNEEGLKTVAAEIEKMGRKCVPVKTDVTNYDSVTAMVAKVKEGLGGKIDVLVNGVGWDIIEPFWKNPIDYWDKVIDVNYKSVIYCSRAVLDDMMEANEGRIINIASDAGRGGSGGETVYAGAKGATIAFTKSLAREVARFNILVNCVCPGPTDTPLFAGQPEKIRGALIKAIPLKRLAKPEEVAGQVILFASDLGSFMTAQIISVSGGLTFYG
ncbi:MAG: SDR family NAD(P)-dependent oxidoreductase [Syntrophomonadaceae bacterium]|jgi:2-hydroxycyclohexanecarboxyl-CoA dehydrogenase